MDNVISMQIADLKPHERNYNKHGDKQIDDLSLSLQKFGQRKPIVTWRDTIVAGHGLTMAAQLLGWTTILTMPVPDEWDEVTVLAYLAADNELARQADPDLAQLAAIAKELEGIDAELAKLAAGGDEALRELLATLEEEKPNGDAEPQIDKAEELRQKWNVELGQMWRLPSRDGKGEHRLICGDCTDKSLVERVMGGEKAVLCHADPPYGMGKEKDGIINDNLYNAKLDEFQMDWWEAQRPHLADNGSAYIWGNAEDLWRLWYRNLQISERLTFRSQIVWDKPPSASSYGSPIGSEKMRSYPHGYETCLFFMLGEQGFNNNADNYWDGWEPIRSILEEDCKKIGWGPKDIQRICGVGMYSHWFTKSQWTFIPEEHYKKLQAAAREHDAFKREHDELKREHDELKREHDELKRDFYATRAYFDNTHDNMTDVWSYPRVTGEERHEHATPKPVAMIERAIKSSSPVGGIVYSPFLGSGTDLIASENTERHCLSCELFPGYVAVALERYFQSFGVTPELINA